MPISIQLTLGAESPVIFDGWIEENFGRPVARGTAFAKAMGPDGPGFVVTNGPMFVSSGAELTIGARVAPGEVIAYGAANGEDIP